VCVYVCGYYSVGITYGWVGGWVGGCVCVWGCVFVCVYVWLCMHTYIYIHTYVDGCLVRWIVEDDADRSAAATKDIAELKLEDVRVVASSRYEDVLNGCKKIEIKKLKN
jgi:hypothetical protein